MTIPHEALTAATVVAPVAQEKKGLINPYISLQSLESLCQGNETLTECLNTMVIYSLRYAETVCRFKRIVDRGQVSNEDGTRAEIEHVRSTVHDANIAAINILSRNLKIQGKDNSWISKVSAAGRAVGYGKFALLIAFEAALQQNA